MFTHNNWEESGLIKGSHINVIKVLVHGIIEKIKIKSLLANMTPMRTKFVYYTLFGKL